jgi:flavin-dependent dehydrogenase
MAPSLSDRSVVLRGTGVAALTCAHLLGGSGWAVAGQDTRPQLHLLLQEKTAQLLAALWDDPDLLRDTHRVASRMVCWADPGAAEKVAAPGVVIAAEELRRRLAARLEVPRAYGGGWVIDGQWDTGTRYRSFGHRQAWVATALLRETARDDVCIMEATPEGWMFLLPCGGGQATVQLVRLQAETSVPNLQSIISATRLMSGSVSDVGVSEGPFPAMPRLRVAPTRPPLADQPGLMAVGEAAAAFDPVSGDGVGHGLRGAVLAARVLQSIAGGAHIQACLTQYENILSRAMFHHLTLCVGCYRNAATAYAWRTEIERMI